MFKRTGEMYVYENAMKNMSGKTLIVLKQTSELAER